MTDPIREALADIVSAYERRSELFTNDAGCAANLADRARAALSAPAQEPVVPAYCEHAWVYGQRYVGCVLHCGLPKRPWPAASAQPAPDDALIDRLERRASIKEMADQIANETRPNCEAADMRFAAAALAARDEQIARMTSNLETSQQWGKRCEEMVSDWMRAAQAAEAELARWNELHRVIAEESGADPATWPDHRNAPLAIGAKFMLMKHSAERTEAELARCREAVAWVLWHHQGGSSPTGQPLRRLFKLGPGDHLPDDVLAAAKRFDVERGPK